MRTMARNEQDLSVDVNRNRQAVGNRAGKSQNNQCFKDKAINQEKPLSQRQWIKIRRKRERD